MLMYGVRIITTHISMRETGPGSVPIPDDVSPTGRSPESEAEFERALETTLQFMLEKRNERTALRETEGEFKTKFINAFLKTHEDYRAAERRGTQSFAEILARNMTEGDEGFATLRNENPEVFRQTIKEIVDVVRGGDDEEIRVAMERWNVGAEMNAQLPIVLRRLSELAEILRKDDLSEEEREKTKQEVEKFRERFRKWGVGWGGLFLSFGILSIVCLTIMGIKFADKMSKGSVKK